MLCLSWRETGRSGGVREGASEFGHALLQTIVPTALGGSARLQDDDEDVFLYELRIPSTQFF